MRLSRAVAVGIMAGVALLASGSPAFADPPDGHFYDRQIELRDGSGGCGAGMGAPKWNGEFNPGQVSNAFLTDCHLTGPRETTVNAGVNR